MVKILMPTYYNGIQYEVGKSYPLDASIEKRWIKNNIAEKSYSINFNLMTNDELSEYAEKNNIDIHRLRSRESVISKLEKLIIGE